MFTRIKRAFRQLRRDKPGQRFKNRYRRVRQEGGMAWWARVLLYVTALVSTAIGVVLVFIPGPAVLFFFIAGGVLSTESLVIARGLDWSELKLRALVERLRTWWRGWRRK